MTKNRIATTLALTVTMFGGLVSPRSAEAVDCALSGVTVVDGQSRYFYSTQWVSSFQSETCSSPTIRELRTCTNGVLSGSYVFTDCSKGTIANLTKFTVIGDSRSNSETDGSQLQLVVDAIKTWGTHMHYVVSTGDIFDSRYLGGDTPRERADYQIAPLASYLTTSMSTNKLWNAMGNHEYYGDSDGSIYDDIFPYPQRHYDIKRGPVHFLFVDLSEAYFLDPNTTAITITGTSSLATQKAWLKDTLKNSTSMWKIVVAHYPHGVDFYQFNWDWYGMGVDIVLTGHVHAYLRYTDKHGVRYFINGSGGCDMNGNACGPDPLQVRDRLKTSDEYGRDLSIMINTCIDKEPSGDNIYGYQRMVADERYIDLSFYDTSGTGHGAQLDHDIIYSSTTKGIRDNTRKSDLQKIAAALEKHYQRYGSFTQPETLDSDCSTGEFGAEGCGEGDDWSATSNLRVLLADGDLGALPVDPINSSFFHYKYEVFNVDANHSVDGWGYSICASKLEMTGTHYCITKEKVVVTDADCRIAGITVPHGESREFYLLPTVPDGQTCDSQARTCTDGTLSGNVLYASPSCSVLPAQSCAFADQIVTDGSSVTAYQAATVPYGQSCAFEERTCVDGQLSGSFAHGDCSASSAMPDVGSTPDHPLAGGCSVATADGTSLALCSLAGIFLLMAFLMRRARRRRTHRE